MKEPVARHQWVALVLALLSQWSASMAGQALYPLAALLQQDLGLSKSEIGLLASAIAVGGWAFVLAGGFLTDRFGIRRAMSVALVMTGSFLGLMSTVGSLLQATAVMFAAGVSRGTVFTSSTKAILDWFPHRTRATAMGLKQMGMPMSGIVAASTLPILGLLLGWRAAMAAPGFLIVAAGIATAILYREAPLPERVSAARVGLRTAMGELMRNRGLWVMCGVAFAFLLAQMALLTYLALYLNDVVLVQQVPDDSTRLVVAGGFLAICQLGGSVARVAWGVVSDRVFHGRRAVVLAIVGGIAVPVSLAMASLGSDCPLWLLTIVVFASGATLVGWNGVYNAMVTETVGRRYAATGLGLSMTVTEGGTTLGPPLFGFVVDFTGSYGTGWLLLGCISAVGALLAIVAARSEKRPAIRRP